MHSFKLPYEILMINIWEMRLDLPGAFFLQASLLNHYYKYIENAPGSSSCIPSSFQAYLLNPSCEDIEMHLDFPSAFH